MSLDPVSPAVSRIALSRLMTGADVNLLGTVHGGVMMKLVDDAAGMVATRHSLGPAVTAAMDEMAFLFPVHVGELVHTFAQVNWTGRTSMEIVVRVDGHGLLAPGYIAAAVRLLREAGAANVGGVMHAEGVTVFERAVAIAMTSKLGVGNAKFHTGGAAGPAETVYLGVFRREILEKHHGYNEAFIRAQDWELNHRIRESGGLVYFSPELHVTYRPRPDFGKLARQYFDYGRWRRVVMRTHSGTASLRYLAPPLAVLAVVLGTLLGIVSLFTVPWLAVGFAAPVGYLLGIGLGSLRESRGQAAGVRLRLPLVLATMHASWGWGFLTSPKSLYRSTLAS